jgi:release factor glutamine methyltransferase
MQLLEILKKSEDFFRQKGVDSPRLKAEMLLAHVFQIPRMQVYVQFERPLNPSEVDQMRDYVKRISQFEPIQYVLGETEFYGLRLECSSAALIPRPETETLVEMILKEIPKGEEVFLYEVGSGTGAIPIALSYTNPKIKIKSFDISPEALALAKKNADQYPDLKVEFLQNDLLSNQTEPAWAVVANLPYLNEEEMKNLPPEVQKEPKLALDGGKEGLDLIEKLIQQSAKLTTRIYLETGIHHTATVEELLKQNGFMQTQTVRDLSDKPRFVVGKKN